jgi:ribosomal protein S18 acetylase RimI-like enzyme
VDFAPARIREYQSGDLDDLYRICLQTADSGQDATALFTDPLLPGHIYAAPYGVLEPSLAFVAEDASGVGGYVVAALDSRAFEERLERDWWPALRARYPEPAADDAAVMSRNQLAALEHIHRPLRVDEGLAERYPSHLHINLVPRLQGQGIGRGLITALSGRLRARGSTGLHLFVAQRNERAVGFYRRVGFTDLPATGAHIFAMDLASRDTPDT